MSDTGKLTKDDARNQSLTKIGNYLAPFVDAKAITPSDTDLVTAGRQFVVFCSVAGNVKVTFKGGGTLTFPAATGLTIYNWSIIQVWFTGTGATATYSNLY